MNGTTPHGIIPVFFEAIEGLAVVQQLCAKCFYAFMGFFLLSWDELFLGHFVVVVYSSGQGGEGGGYLTCQFHQNYNTVLALSQEGNLAMQATRSRELRRRYRDRVVQRMIA